PCTLNPCKHDGKCTVTSYGYECSCESPYSGKECEEDLCRSNPCKNGGTCYVANGVVDCKCKVPYFGNLCEKYPCTPNPCHNGGKCEIIPSGYKCSCKTPYSGKNCGKDPCDPNPCKNAGSCIVYNGDYFCVCQHPYSGRFCEEDPCSSRPCQNGGKCSVIDGEYDCTCPLFYSGKQCEKMCSCGQNSSCFFDENGFKRCVCIDGYEEINGVCKEACDIYPCVHGTCVKTAGKGVFCKCDENHKGISCDVQVDKITENRKEITAVLILQGAVLIVTMAVLISFCYVYCRNCRKGMNKKIMKIDTVS
ncbi:adhesive plaque matrix protein 2-like, partial [Stegodyphus dumicola]|uniref:adhesive plaque matrix protein 2-like n=1 Tax=Stegodyphus dumicola TaxID=202533 RepID=UPI0015AC5F8C